MEDKNNTLEKYKDDMKTIAQHIKEDASKLGDKAKDGMDQT